MAEKEQKIQSKPGDRVMRILAVVFLVVALGVVGFTVHLLAREKLPILPGASANYVVNKEMPVYEFGDADSEKPEGYQEAMEFGQYIFVGDSRFVGMQSNKESNDVFIAEVGEGYYYMCQHIGDIMAEATTDSAIIIGMGVNDLGNLDKYVKKINEMANNIPCQIVFITVNPVDETKTTAHGYNVTNEKIDAFNETMMNELSEKVRIIDTNSYLWQNGFDSPDGIHYSGETNRALYLYIKSVL